jgi:hypothetical protein
LSPKVPGPRALNPTLLGAPANDCDLMGISGSNRSRIGRRSGSLGSERKTHHFRRDASSGGRLQHLRRHGVPRCAAGHHRRRCCCMGEWRTIRCQGRRQIRFAARQLSICLWGCTSTSKGGYFQYTFFFFKVAHAEIVTHRLLFSVLDKN